jgi:hypothetical protein
MWAAAWTVKTKEWYEFQHQLKNFATKNFMTFGSQNINRLKYSMQGQAALKEGLFELERHKERELEWWSRFCATNDTSQETNGRE